MTARKKSAAKKPDPEPVEKPETDPKPVLNPVYDELFQNLDEEGRLEVLKNNIQAEAKEREANPTAEQILIMAQKQLAKETAGKKAPVTNADDKKAPTVTNTEGKKALETKTAGKNRARSASEPPPSEEVDEEEDDDDDSSEKMDHELHFISLPQGGADPQQAIAAINVKHRIVMEPMWKVDQLLANNDNRPLQALWEALNDNATPGIEIPMAIVMDPRCGIERRAEKDDYLVTSEAGMPLNDSTPLMMAVHAHRNDVVEALLDAGADPSACDIFCWTAFLAAATYGNVTAMDLLVRHGADPLAFGKPNGLPDTALHIAAFEGQAQAIQVLVELGASTEAVDGDGDTPLLRTAYFGNVPSIAALLDNGANLDAVDREGRTILHRAILRGHIGAIEALVWEGASITARHKSGCTPLEILHKSSRNGLSYAEKARAIALLTPTLLH